MSPGIIASLLAVALTAPLIGVASDALAADRTSRRSGELSLPDPYLDPSWPDTAGEELEDRYGPGKSDSVEEVPFDEELEMQEELRARQEITGETPSAGALPPPPALAAPGTAAAPPSEVGEGTEPAPQEPEPYVPRDDEDLDLEERDPVEW